MDFHNDAQAWSETSTLDFRRQESAQLSAQVDQRRGEEDTARADIESSGRSIENARQSALAFQERIALLAQDPTLEVQTVVRRLNNAFTSTVQQLGPLITEQARIEQFLSDHHEILESAIGNAAAHASNVTAFTSFRRWDDVPPAVIALISRYAVAATILGCGPPSSVVRPQRQLQYAAGLGRVSRSWREAVNSADCVSMWQEIIIRDENRVDLAKAFRKRVRPHAMEIRVLILGGNTQAQNAPPQGFVTVIKRLRRFPVVRALFLDNFDFGQHRPSFPGRWSANLHRLHIRNTSLPFTTIVNIVSICSSLTDLELPANTSPTSTGAEPSPLHSPALQTLQIAYQKKSVDDEDTVALLLASLMSPLERLAIDLRHSRLHASPTEPLVPPPLFYVQLYPALRQFVGSGPFLSDEFASALLASALHLATVEWSHANLTNAILEIVADVALPLALELQHLMVVDCKNITSDGIRTLVLSRSSRTPPAGTIPIQVKFKDSNIHDPAEAAQLRLLYESHYITALGDRNRIACGVCYPDLLDAFTVQHHFTHMRCTMAEEEDSSLDEEEEADIEDLEDTENSDGHGDGGEGDDDNSEE